MDVLPEQPAGQEGQGHEGRPKDRRAAFDEERIKDKEEAEGEARGPPGQADEPEEAEEQAGDDGDVAARDREKVVKARLPQVLDGRFVQAAVLAEKEGLENGPVRRDVEAVGGREAAFE